MKKNQNKIRTRAVLMASGGPDSTVLAYMLKETHLSEFTMLAIDHGNDAGTKEIETAKFFADELRVPFKSININTLWGELSDVRPKYLDTMMGGPCNDAYPLVLVAATWAGWAGADSLYLGMHADDLRGQGWLTEALEHYQSVLTLVNQNEKDFSQVTIRTPLIGFTKSEVLRLGKRLKVPFEKTWTCDKKGDRHCGKCRHCRSRKLAFSEAGLDDLTNYVK